MLYVIINLCSSVSSNQYYTFTDRLNRCSPHTLKAEPYLPQRIFLPQSYTE